MRVRLTQLGTGHVDSGQTDSGRFGIGSGRAGAGWIGTNRFGLEPVPQVKSTQFGPGRFDPARPDLDRHGQARSGPTRLDSAGGVVAFCFGSTASVCGMPCRGEMVAGLQTMEWPVVGDTGPFARRLKSASRASGGVPRLPAGQARCHG